nr:ABC transporter G family member 32-like isoform X2 [Tanacetum cinerariifolium]
MSEGDCSHIIDNLPRRLSEVKYIPGEFLNQRLSLDEVLNHYWLYDLDTLGGGMRIWVTLISYFRIKPLSLYGLLTSQYRDADEPLKLAHDSRSLPLRQFMKDQFGYEHELLRVGATAV